MKNIFLFMVVVIFTACSSNNNWEYKTVTITGESASEFVSNTFNVTDEDLNLFGAEGWELVNVYTCLLYTSPPSARRQHEIRCGR